VSKKIKKENKNKNLKVWKETLKSVQKLEFNKNKWIEYTKELMKEFLLKSI